MVRTTHRSETVRAAAARLCRRVVHPQGAAAGGYGVAVHLRVEADELLAMARVDLGLAEVARQRLDLYQ